MQSVDSETGPLQEEDSLQCWVALALLLALAQPSQAVTTSAAAAAADVAVAALVAVASGAASVAVLALVRCPYCLAFLAWRNTCLASAREPVEEVQCGACKHPPKRTPGASQDYQDARAAAIHKAAAVLVAKAVVVGGLAACSTVADDLADVGCVAVGSVVGAADAVMWNTVVLLPA